MNIKKVLIVAGGTGGHVFPGLAVANDLIDKGHQVCWFGTDKGIEATLVPESNIELLCIDIKGVRGKGLKTLLLAPFRIFNSIIQSMILINRLKPQVMLCMGGFVSGPAGIAAKLMRVPLVVHEQNAIAGTTNALLSKVANINLQAFPDTLSPQAITVGNPVRASIKSIAPSCSSENDRLKVLVVGGSLGAKAINRLIPELFSEMIEDIEVWHQAGKKNYDEVVMSYGSHSASPYVTITAFIDDMAEAYAWADLIICRSGAMTVSELAVVGRASILIPFPFAIDDHQTANAKWLSDADAAILVQQKDITIEKLLSIIQELRCHRLKLSRMGQQAHNMAIFNATERVVEQCLGVAL